MNRSLLGNTFLEISNHTFVFLKTAKTRKISTKVEEISISTWNPGTTSLSSFTVCGEVLQPPGSILNTSTSAPGEMGACGCAETKTHRPFFKIPLQLSPYGLSTRLEHPSQTDCPICCQETAGPWLAHISEHLKKYRIPSFRNSTTLTWTTT